MTTWTTKDGTKIPIRHLTDTHLKNAFELARKRMILSSRVAGALSAEMERRAVEFGMLADDRGPDDEVINGMDNYGSIQ